MGEKRRKYTKEFKIEAVRLIVEDGRPISEVARELGTQPRAYCTAGKRSLRKGK